MFMDHESSLHDVVHEVLQFLGHGVVRQGSIWLPAAGRAGVWLFRSGFLHYWLQLELCILLGGGLGQCRSGQLRQWHSLPLQGPWSLCQSRVSHCQRSLWGMPGGGGLVFCSAPSPFLGSGTSPHGRLLPLMVVFVLADVFLKFYHSPCTLTPLAVQICQLHLNVWLVCIFSTAFHPVSMAAALCSRDRPTNFW